MRRALAYVLTVGAWLIWLAMWVPFLAALGRHLGYDLPEIIFPSQINLHSFLALMHILPTAIATAIGLVVLRYLWEKLKPHAGWREKPWRPVGVERLASGQALDPERLAAWQAAQVLYVAHGPRGRVTGASTVQPSRPD